MTFTMRSVAKGFQTSGLVPSWLENHKGEVSLWLKDLVEERGYRLGSVSYQFLDDKAIRDYNQRLLAHDYATDIITLDHSEGRKRLRVEMLLGVDRIRDYAEDNKLDLEEELCRVMVHGLLHCMGWDDGSIEEKNNMRKEEDICLLSRPK